MIEEDDVGSHELAGLPGFKHALLTWALAAPPIALMVLGVTGQVFHTVIPDLLNAATRTLAWPMLLIGGVHWVFTLGALVSSAFLTARGAPVGRKVIAWVAVLLAVCGSLYIRSTYQF